jgi:hypothetical protein
MGLVRPIYIIINTEIDLKIQKLEKEKAMKKGDIIRDALSDSLNSLFSGNELNLDSLNKFDFFTYDFTNGDFQPASLKITQEDFSKLKKLIDYTGITLKRLCFSLIHNKIMKM